MLKIIFKKEYVELQNKANENHKMSQLEEAYKQQIKNLEADKESLKEETKSIQKNHEESDRIKERDLIELKKDHDTALKRKEEATQSRIDSATKDLNETITKLTIENNSHKKEVEILTKAFSNLGFDVKDMKGILDKLVDGIVSKNKIQILK